MDLSAFALNCSLKSAGEASSTDKLIDEVFVALESHGVSRNGTMRVSDQNIRPGVTSDEGDGEEWPEVRRQILDANILVLGTPIWMGHPSSHAQRVLERLDAFSGRPTQEVAWCHSTGLPLWPSSVTKTARTTLRLTCSRRSATWDSPFLPMA